MDLFRFREHFGHVEIKSSIHRPCVTDIVKNTQDKFDAVSLFSAEKLNFCSCCDNPGKYKKSYYKLCYKQINVYFIFISIKKFHKA